jgi:hypothetical protein
LDTFVCLYRYFNWDSQRDEWITTIVSGPKGVAGDGKGQIYVVDNKASAICVFLTNGRFVGRFGSRGVGDDHLAGPHFIGINSFGHSVVSDFHNHAVKVLINLFLDLLI